MHAPLARSPNTHRSCLALVNLPKYRGHPGDRLVRVAEDGPLVGEPPQVVVQLAERLGSYLCPIVGGPASDDRVEPFDHRLSVASAPGAQLVPEPFPDPSHGGLAGLDQWRGAVPADVESQEVEALAEGDDARLVLIERQAPRPPDLLIATCRSGRSSRVSAQNDLPADRADQGARWRGWKARRAAI